MKTMSGIFMAGTIALLGACSQDTNSQVAGQAPDQAPDQAQGQGSGQTMAASVQPGPVTSVRSGRYLLDQTHASVSWKVMHMGLANYTARFSVLDAQLDFDAEQPENSKLFVQIDPASVVTDYPQGRDVKFASDEDFDAKLAGENWLNAGAYPNITFTSTNITRTSENTGKIAGNLNFLGVSKELILDVVLNAAKPHPRHKIHALGFSATGSLQRSDFGLDRYVGPIADEVKLVIEAEFYEEKESP